MGLKEDLERAWLTGRNHERRRTTFVKDVGFRIGVLSDDELREIRNMVAGQPPDDERGRVVAVTVVELIDGRRAALEERRQSEPQVEVGARVGLGQRILHELAGGQRTTAELSRRLVADDKATSRALGKHRENGLVESQKITGADERLRWHRLTLAGEEAERVLRAVPERQEASPAPIIVMRSSGAGGRNVFVKQRHKFNVRGGLAAKLVAQDAARTAREAAKAAARSKAKAKAAAAAAASDAGDDD